MVGMSNPIPEPAKTANTNVNKKECAIDKPKKPIVNSTNALPASAEKWYRFLKYGMVKEVKPPANATSETAIPALAGEVIP